MAIQFACPWCKATYNVDDRHAGKKTKCARCGEQVQIPDAPPSKTNVSRPASPPPEVPERLAPTEDLPPFERRPRRSANRDRDRDYDYDERPRRSRRRSSQEEED